MVIEYSTPRTRQLILVMSGVTSYKSLNVEDSAMNIYVDFIWIKCNFVTWSIMNIIINVIYSRYQDLNNMFMPEAPL